MINYNFLGIILIVFTLGVVYYMKPHTVNQYVTERIEREPFDSTRINSYNAIIMNDYDYRYSSLIEEMRVNSTPKIFRGRYNLTTISSDTWEKGLPKIYINDEGYIVEHYSDGTIIKKKKARTI